MNSSNGYGAVGHSSTHDGASNLPTTSNSENSPLLGKDTRKSVPRRFYKHMTTDINPQYGDLLLLLCYVITGLLDSSAVFIWGSFVSMQTGNTVYLGLGLVEHDAGTRWIKSGTSIAFFCLGSFFFARYHRWLSPRKRWVLFTSFAAQMTLIIAAAVIVTTDTAQRSRDDLHWEVLVPIALVAFQSSGQAVTSRALQFNALTSVVLTSIYCDLSSDPKLFALHNVERNRRLAAPICLLGGAILGGVWANSSFGLAGALWTAAALKALVVFAWLGWPSKKLDDA